MSFIEPHMKKVCRWIAGIGTGLILTYHVPTLLLPKAYQHEVGHRRNVPGIKYQSLLDEVCTKMNVESNNIDLFFDRRYGSSSAGFLCGLPQNAVIGLPQCCMFDTIEDIKNSKIKHAKKEINWDSQIGKAMLETYVLSDEHVKFLIACELVNIKKLHPVMTTLHATIFWLATSFVASIPPTSLVEGSLLDKIVKKVCGGYSTTYLNLRGSIGIKLILYISLLTLGMSGYVMNQTLLHYWMVYQTDEEVANLGPEYVAAGVECLRKELKFNRVVRKMTADGDAHYTEKGDNIGAQICFPPQTDRLKRLKAFQKSTVMQTNHTSED